MADELQVVSSQVPAQIEELVTFIKVGREKLTAVRAEIRAIDKLGLEDEKRQKVLEQARELSEQLLDAEVSLGEIMATLPEAPGKRTDLEEPADSDVPRSKKEILKQAGFSVKTAQRYEILASHPDIVAQMKAEAREKGVVVSRTAVLRAIKDEETPRFDKQDVEIVGGYLENVKKLLGDIDIKLNGSFDEEKALAKSWAGNLFLFLPHQDMNRYVKKLYESFEDITSALVIVPTETNQKWFRNLMNLANAVVFNVETLTFADSQLRREKQQFKSYETDKPFAFIYIGPNKEKFFRQYRSYGWGISVGSVLIEKDHRYDSEYALLKEVKKK